MQSTIISRKFLLPLLAVWLIGQSLLLWTDWKMYAADFSGKRFPSNLTWKWLFLKSFEVLSSTFLIAVFFAATCYGYSSAKTGLERFRPFNATNLAAIFLLGCLSFAFVSYIQPGKMLESRVMLTNIVYANNYSEFKSVQNTGNFTIEPATLNSTQLMAYRGEMLKRIRNSQTQNQGNNSSSPEHRMVRESNQVLADRRTYPLILISFLLIGISLGWLFRNQNLFIPLIISMFILYPLWELLSRRLKNEYRNEQINSYVGLYGIATIFALLAMTGVLLVEKRRHASFRPARK